MVKIHHPISRTQSSNREVSCSLRCTTSHKMILGINVCNFCKMQMLWTVCNALFCIVELNRMLFMVSMTLTWLIKLHLSIKGFCTRTHEPSVYYVVDVTTWHHTRTQAGSCVVKLIINEVHHSILPLLPLSPSFILIPDTFMWSEWSVLQVSQSEGDELKHRDYICYEPRTL